MKRGMQLNASIQRDEGMEERMERMERKELDGAGWYQMSMKERMKRGCRNTGRHQMPWGRGNKEGMLQNCTK
jgi:hypothetical protein